ncbi:hypothetical protein BIY37_04765 [Candidatus Brocadia sapporoensis]|uniref:DUF2190 domain-containing protein n=1 Tax=Candidatus Brocadia sapporoensis TaxID=392547 RepID=A0A1V6M1C4_9BACT|nr:hypothetical protein [Candidatus Brocadia sapporoensis]MDG6005546.1 hypothetical protein [Candidatus Brocadia sp.]OQD46136.1 hypothetical protein BIY37_04765 [Candidatus Brocadia sapporoensis]GJQ23579.1 MAG: hypothetical protein HBSAPP01_13690 [Candidatus Brocadia sapporoensis]
MATENGVLDLSFEAAESLTNDQYRFVVLTTDSPAKVRRPDAQNEIPFGVLQNAPASGGAAVVRRLGVTKLQAGAALTNNTFVRIEYNDAADAGKAVPLVANEGYAVGLVVGSASAEDDLATVDLIPATPGI